MNFSTILSENERVLAYFSTPDCSVCKSLKPKVKELTSRINGIEFLYINTRENPAIAGQHLVFAVPTIIIFDKGKERKRWSRMISIRELQAELENL